MPNRRFPAEFPARDHRALVRAEEQAASEVPQVWQQSPLTIGWQASRSIFATGALARGEGHPFGWLYQSNWKTPMFDLRPDLRSALGQPKSAVTGTTIGGAAIGIPSSTEMWNRDARLYVEVTYRERVFPFAGDLQQMGSPVSVRIQMDEWYSLHNLGVLPIAVLANQPANGTTMSPLVDVTNQFMYPLIRPGAPCTAGIAIFSPPGTDAGGGGIGHPVRFWLVRLHFTMWYESVFEPAGPIPPAPFEFVVSAGMY